MKKLKDKDLIAFLNSRLEDERPPALIRAMCEKHQGKVLTKRHVPDGFHIRRQYEMTHIENDGCWQKDTPLHSFIVGWRETNVIIPDPETMRENNTHAFKGREERNAARREMLADDDHRRTLLIAINKVRSAVQSYRDAIERLEILSPPHYTDSCEIGRLAGRIQEKGN